MTMDTAMSVPGHTAAVTAPAIEAHDLVKTYIKPKAELAVNRERRVGRGAAVRARAVDARDDERIHVGTDVQQTDGMSTVTPGSR